MTASGGDGSARPRIHWERWTIDEIADDVCRLLAARPRSVSRLTRLRLHRPDAEAAAPERHRYARSVRRAAMTLELAPAATTWTAEVTSFTPEDALAAFLGRRGGKPGLPTDRPLREGDVFLVLLPGISGSGERLEPPTLMPFSEADAPGRLEALLRAGADVWDLTAAARQAAKRTYESVVRAGEPAAADAPVRRARRSDG